MPQALVSTIGYLDQAGLAHVGAAATADGSTDYTQNIDGVNIGFIGYTNSTNGYLRIGFGCSLCAEYAE